MELLEENRLIGTSSGSESGPIVSGNMGRVMTTLLNAKPKKLEDAISRLQSPPQIAPITVSMEQSLWFLHKYIAEAAQNGEHLDRVLVPILQHSLTIKESKHGNQAMILLNWLFQDEMFCGVILRNFTDILSRRDDRYVALGWCNLGRKLIEYENVVGSVLTNAIREKQGVILTTFSSCVTHILFIICNGSIMQDGFELPTRLAISAADFVLSLTLALTRKDLESNLITKKQKSSLVCGENQPSSLSLNATKHRYNNTSKRTPETPSSLDLKLLLWNNRNELIILVEKLIAWSRKSRYLHAEGLKRVFKWLQELKLQYECSQDETEMQVLKTGSLLLSSCWKHYSLLMRVDDQKFSQQHKELLNQYLSGIQFYGDNQSEEPNIGKSSKSETTNFFLNCLLLLLGRLDNQLFENAITESGSQISQVLMSQLQSTDEDVIEGSVTLFKAVIFKTNHTLSKRGLSDVRQMDALLPTLFNLLDERDAAAKAIVKLLAEYCSICSDRTCLNEVLMRIHSQNVAQRRNAIDVVADLIHITSGAADTLSQVEWQDVANHLLECLGDKDEAIQNQAAKLIPMIDPRLVLPMLVDLSYSPHESLQISASTTLIALLVNQKDKPEVLCILLDCLSKLSQNPDPDAPADRKGGMHQTLETYISTIRAIFRGYAYQKYKEEMRTAFSKYQIMPFLRWFRFNLSFSGSTLDDRLLKLLPEWANHVENWHVIVGPLIDKMLAEPSNAVIVRFLSHISEYLAEAVDLVFNRLIEYMREQNDIDESFSEGKGRTDSNNEAIKHEHCLFTRLCPLLVIRLLPLRVFDDLNSPLVYGEIPNISAVHGVGHSSVEGTECIATLMINRALSKSEFEDVRKLAAELCGRIHPEVLIPMLSSQLESAVNAKDVFKIKVCLFSLCTSLMVRGDNAYRHPDLFRIRKTIEKVLSWTSLDKDENCLALVLCTELQAPKSSKAITDDSVLAYVINQLSNGKEDIPFQSDERAKASAQLSFRLCMANVLISASQKISDTGKKPYVKKIVPRVIRSAKGAVEPEIRDACIQVLFSVAYRWKSSIVPYSNDLLSIALKSLREGPQKEKLGGAKLLMCLMANEEEVIESISGGLLEARSLLQNLSSTDSSPQVRQICQQLLVCFTFS